MTRSTRIAFVGNSLPRRCGIATFTTDLHQAVSGACDRVATSIFAMTDRGHVYDYPASVACVIRDDRIEDYHRAAALVNGGGFDVVSLQHEYGIFGGEAGGHVLALLTRLTVPVVTTLHTVLAEPSAAQRHVLERIVALSHRVVVMADKGRELLRAVYAVDDAKIDVVPHGIPQFDFVEPEAAKQALDLDGRMVLLTFGLLGPSKGIEVVIDAMPEIIARCPEAIYVVLGATHPNLVHAHGEAYRESLMARVRERGAEAHVRFVDQFVDKPTLLRFIAACDVYVTPYLNEMQMTSGTLAYSFGLGRAVVSTPYWHARELLAAGQGVLVPFGDAAAVGDAVGALLTDHPRREAMRRRAYAASREMTWDRVGQRYLAIFAGAAGAGAVARVARMPADGALPGVQLGHFLTLCDDTGIAQHAIHAVPDRAHGYCVDDNARALLVACALNEPGEVRLPEVLTSRLAAFVQHAWNPEARRFRNFMGYDRRWLEDAGSEDSHGRTLWALGECARGDANPSRRRWAASLFSQALAPVEAFTSPRAWAFTLLGLDAYRTTLDDAGAVQRLQAELARRLMARLSASETQDWVWFERGLAYDNARLPQALIATGVSTASPSLVVAGLRTLRWLVARQTGADGQFRPVGTMEFGEEQSPPHAFDQQPLEAAATIAACMAAARAEGDAMWHAEAARAIAWFLGANDLGVPLVDGVTGACRDGLHPDRANENRGAESVLSYLLGLLEMRRLAREMSGRVVAAPRLAVPVALPVRMLG